MADRNHDPADLRQARKKASKLRLSEAGYTLVVCMDRKSAKCCCAKSMDETWRYLKRRCKQWRKDGQPVILRIKSGCIGVCKSGPIIGVFPDRVWYGVCTPNVVDRIFDEHLSRGEVVEDYVIAQA